MIAVLKTIGIVLLVLLALVLAVLLLVLLIPARYRGNLSLNERLKFDFQAGWPHRGIGVWAEYNQALSYGLLLFGVRKKPKADKDRQEDTKETAEDTGKSVPAEPTKHAGITQPEKHAGITQPEKHAGITQPEKHAGITQPEIHAEIPGQEKRGETCECKTAADRTLRQNADSPVPDSAKKDDSGKQTHTIMPEAPDNRMNSGNAEDKQDSLLTKIRQYYEILTREENQAVWDFLKKKLKKLLGHIFPRQIEGDLTIGSEFPEITGYSLAFLAFLYPYFGDSIAIHPVYDRECLEFEAKFKGRVCIGFCLLIVLQVWFNKEFRRFLWELRSRNS